MDLSPLRSQFPSLQLHDPEGRPYVFLDAPGGTQVTQGVIDAMADYLVHSNANFHGTFATSLRTDETIARARQSAVDLLNAPSPEEIVFGPNMTTLTFHLSHAIEKELRPGDEVVVTYLDHDANFTPWARLEEKGIVVRRVDFHPEDCTLDMEQMERFINERTRLVAVGYASNSAGTINDIPRIAAWAHAVGAWLYVDAVHYAPHGPIDVQAAGCDFLACSAYKFFGPHLGLLWGKREILERLHPPKVRPAANVIPWCYETGTQNHEGEAGLSAAVDYLAEVGRRFGDRQNGGGVPGYSGRRQELKAGLSAIQAYEREIGWQIIRGLQAIPGLHIYGITDPALAAWRVPTVILTMDGLTPLEIARRLAAEAFFCYNGHFYAINLTEKLGLEASGGVLRVGLAHYNTREEVERFLEAVERL